MPRRARRDNYSQYIHVIIQGINRENIFNNEIFRYKYYSLLLEKSDMFNNKLLAYCIMNNHAHLLFYIKNIVMLGKYMKSVNTSYAQYYNKCKKRVGYVFRDRYLSRNIYTENQLYNTIAYIHFNPIEAGIVHYPSEYKYSSYNDFINRSNIVDDESIKLIFGSLHDYLKLFIFIHYGFENGMEPINKPNINCENIKIGCIDIKNKEELLKECLRLKKLYISNRKIAEILQIDRNKIDRILKMRQ